MNNSEYIPYPTYEQTPRAHSGEVVHAQTETSNETARAVGEAMMNAGSVYDEINLIPGLEPRVRPLTLEQMHQLSIDTIARDTRQIVSMRQDELALEA